MPQWKDFASWVFYGLIGYVALNMSSNMEKIQTGVTELNKQVAVIITESNSAKKSIDDHEVRIRILETKNK